VFEPADWEALLQRSILPKLAQSLQTVSAALRVVLGWSARLRVCWWHSSKLAAAAAAG
jgi:hypothetical protein